MLLTWLLRWLDMEPQQHQLFDSWVAKKLLQCGLNGLLRLCCQCCVGMHWWLCM